MGSPQAADRDAYLKFAGNLEGFLAQLRGNARGACCGQGPLCAA
jgi:hypothetical protein